jgi:hypothetical protein
MVKTDGSGDVQWDRTVGGADFDYMYSVREVKKNLYVAGGYSNSKATGDKKLSSKGGYDYWLVQVNYNEPATIANSFMASLQNHDLKSGNKDFIVYPNPAKNMLYVQTNGTGTLTLTSQSGKILYTKIINGKGEINISNLSAGLYFLKNNAMGTVQKVVVSR